MWFSNWKNEKNYVKMKWASNSKEEEKKRTLEAIRALEIVN